MKNRFLLGSLFGTAVILGFAFFNFVQDAPDVDWNPNTAVRLSTLVNSTTHDATVATGVVAYIDNDVSIRNLTVNGQLHCLPTAGLDLEVRAQTVYVNGLIQCGRPTLPVAGHVTFTLVHRGDVDPRTNPAYRGMIVNSGGKLLLFGSQRSDTPAWLTAPVAAGATTVHVQLVTSGWHIGDEVVITGTEFADQNERRMITSFGADHSTINLSAPLTWSHYEGPEHFSLHGVDHELNESARVVNLTRQILIHPDAAYLTDDDTPTGQLGGHVMVMAGGAG